MTTIKCDKCSSCAIAADNGHLNCLKYLHENGWQWNKYTCFRAASTGHLDCLKYAHENGCPCKHNITIITYDSKLDVKAPTDSIQQCCICFDNEEKVKFEPCNHKVCISCLNKLIGKKLKLNCPFCRTPVKKNILIQ